MPTQNGTPTRSPRSAQSLLLKTSPRTTRNADAHSPKSKDPLAATKLKVEELGATKYPEDEEIDFSIFNEAVTAFDEECQNFIHTMSYEAAVRKSELFGQIMGVSGATYGSAFDDIDNALFLNGDNDGGKGDLELKDVNETPPVQKTKRLLSRSPSRRRGRPSKMQQAIDDVHRLKKLILEQVDSDNATLNLADTRWSRHDIHAIIDSSFFADQCLKGVRTVHAGRTDIKIPDLCCLVQALPQWIASLTLRCNSLGYGLS